VVFELTEDEYYDSDKEFNSEGEFGDRFLSEEYADDRINIVQLPVFDYDMKEILTRYLKTLKKCKSTEEAMFVLQELYEQIRILTIIEVECENLQNQAHDLEMLMEQTGIR
jgi:hypothetical protein